MASNEASGGYDCDWVDEPPDDYKCQICLSVAKVPHQHGQGGCGKVFCESCITKHKETSDKCPNCRKTLSTFQDERSARHIKALKVRCGNLNNGCKWVGELGDIGGHLQTCAHAFVSCTNKCKNNNDTVKVLRKDLEDHLASCPRREFPCLFCEVIGEYHERTTTHLNTCPKVQVRCPNDQCNFSILRCEVTAHRSICDCKLVPCKYAEVGCEVISLRKDLGSHEENDQLHLRITTETVLRLKEETNDLNNDMADLKKETTDLKDETTVVKTKFERELAKLQREMTELKTKLKPTTPFLFKLTNLRQLIKKECNELCSPPFYTSATGYKLCVKVSISDFAKVLEVVVCLMKGENDGSLSWPFIGKVKVRLLNQIENNYHYKWDTIECSENDDASRKVEHGERRKAHDPPLFISLDSLEHKGYLKDDTLVFLVKVSDIANYKPWLERTE